MKVPCKRGWNRLVWPWLLLELSKMTSWLVVKLRSKEWDGFGERSSSGDELACTYLSKYLVLTYLRCGSWKLRLDSSKSSAIKTTHVTDTAFEDNKPSWGRNHADRSPRAIRRIATRAALTSSDLVAGRFGWAVCFCTMAYHLFQACVHIYAHACMFVNIC